LVLSVDLLDEGAVGDERLPQRKLSLVVLDEPSHLFVDVLLELLLEPVQRFGKLEI
jgi:hypothetical protein